MVQLLPKAVHGLSGTSLVGSEGGRRDRVEGGLVGRGEFLEDLDARETFPLS